MRTIHNRNRNNKTMIRLKLKNKITMPSHNKKANPVIMKNKTVKTNNKTKTKKIYD